MNTDFSIAQHRTKNNFSGTIDSLTQRIFWLEKQISKLEGNRSLAYYNIKNELNQTQFAKSYLQYVQDENLHQAKSLVESKLERAEFRREKNLIDFYSKYLDDINKEIKDQRIYYQQLFEKEKNYKKVINDYIKEGTLSSLEKAKQINDLAIKYASENQLTGTLQYLEIYRKKIQAFTFDMNSPYDLEIITSDERAFNKEFFKLIDSDSITKIASAEELVYHCMFYINNVNSILDSAFFNKKKKFAANAISDYYDRIGAKMNYEKMSDQAVLARLDTINPIGVYKWHDKIVVINEFIPEYNSQNLKKGEAILESDKKLFKYIKDQDVFKLKDNYAIKGTFFIPYQRSGLKEEFFYNFTTKRWQYMLCYSVLENTFFTKEVSKYMPPIVFKEEDLSLNNPK